MTKCKTKSSVSASQLWFCLVLSLLLACSSEVAMAESKHDWELDIEIGYEHDSTVVIDEIDTIDNNEGSSALYNVSGNYSFQANDETDYSFGYAFSGKDFLGNDDLDTEIHILSGQFNHQFDRLSGGVRVHAIKSKLGSERFLDINQVASYVAFFLDKQWYNSVNFTYGDKDIITEPSRSAIVNTISNDLYYFANGIRRYWQLSYHFRNEQATDPQFSFLERQFRLGYSYKFLGFTKQNELNVQFRYLDRNYGEAPESISGLFRNDDRKSFEISLASDFSEHLYGQIKYEFADNNSNIPEQEFEQNIWGFNLGYRF